ncbi:MAG: rubrerythrin [Marinilabiliales bacterium]|jgi:rubrerythrin|nr:MAG: rubrerythrin [Marinilabiliales bacterium]
MKEFNNVNDILDFAIDEEQKAMDFYRDLAKTAKSDDMREAFEGFAQEELGHKTKLIQVKETGIMEGSQEKVADLKIADFSVNVKATPDMTYQEALVLAMNKEKAAFKLYTTLSERVNDESLKELFLGLALEESKHKLRFELEYDEFVLREN